MTTIIKSKKPRGQKPQVPVTEIVAKQNDAAILAREKGLVDPLPQQTSVTDKTKPQPVNRGIKTITDLKVDDPAERAFMKRIQPGLDKLRASYTPGMDPADIEAKEARYIEQQRANLRTGINAKNQSIIQRTEALSRDAAAKANPTADDVIKSTDTGNFREVPKGTRGAEKVGDRYYVKTGEGGIKPVPSRVTNAANAQTQNIPTRKTTSYKQVPAQTPGAQQINGKWVLKETVEEPVARGASTGRTAPTKVIPGPEAPVPRDPVAARNEVAIKQQTNAFGTSDPDNRVPGRTAQQSQKLTNAQAEEIKARAAANRAQNPTPTEASNRTVDLKAQAEAEAKAAAKSKGKTGGASRTKVGTPGSPPPEAPAKPSAAQPAAQTAKEKILNQKFVGETAQTTAAQKEMAKNANFGDGTKAASAPKAAEQVVKETTEEAAKKGKIARGVEATKSAIKKPFTGLADDIAATGKNVLRGIGQGVAVTAAYEGGKLLGEQEAVQESTLGNIPVLGQLLPENVQKTSIGDIGNYIGENLGRTDQFLGDKYREYVNPEAQGGALQIAGDNIATTNQQLGEMASGNQGETLTDYVANNYRNNIAESLAQVTGLTAQEEAMARANNVPVTRQELAAANENRMTQGAGNQMQEDIDNVNKAFGVSGIQAGDYTPGAGAAGGGAPTPPPGVDKDGYMINDRGDYIRGRGGARIYAGTGAPSRTWSPYASSPRDFGNRGRGEGITPFASAGYSVTNPNQAAKVGGVVQGITGSDGRFIGIGKGATGHQSTPEQEYNRAREGAIVRQRQEDGIRAYEELAAARRDIFPTRGYPTRGNVAKLMKQRAENAAELSKVAAANTAKERLQFDRTKNAQEQAVEYRKIYDEYRQLAFDANATPEQREEAINSALGGFTYDTLFSNAPEDVQKQQFLSDFLQRIYRQERDVFDKYFTSNTMGINFANRLTPRDLQQLASNTTFFNEIESVLGGIDFEYGDFPDAAWDAIRAVGGGQDINTVRQQIGQR